MPDFSAVTREHVLLAVDEYDRLGDEDFLTEHGFEKAPAYVLRNGGKDYDSKAVLGVAHGYATGKAASSQEFSGGKEGAAKVLRALGFDVAYLARTSEAGDEPATGQWVEASDLGNEAAHSAWATAAREALIETAGTYNEVVVNKDLAVLVQSSSGVRSSQLMHYWMGDVLARVAKTCQEGDEPMLTALCVSSTGSVGNGYAAAVAQVRGEAPDDPDEHASQERLACYRFFGADLPSDGGVAAHTPQVSAARSRLRKAKALDKPPVLCPTCFMEMPVAAACNYCE